ncbi:MAG: F420-dependent methylenetetrahydromethanopterin dehydrogenase [Aigarchaeota archaeon]|nr:F420-dependent methylenetetrahydromethanopterin dehydrogenase [Aigarchaeota archaeon]
MVVRVLFVKLGNIGSSPMLEYCIDERADREDLDVRVVTSGSKLSPEDAADLMKLAAQISPQIVIVVSPNATLPGPMTVAKEFAGKDIPTIFVTDKPGSKAAEGLEKMGHGYLVVNADSMIGARREFLDPTEMALFNAEMVGVLSATGVYAFLTQEIEKVIAAVKENRKPTLPRAKINSELATEGFFTNPYARCKAIAALEIAEQVAKITTRACFVEKDRDTYTTLCSSAHEMLSAALELSREAREIEKAGDHLLRQPHMSDGSIGRKSQLLEKPVKRSSE